MVSTLLPRRGVRRIPALRRAQLSAEVQQKRLPPGQSEPPARFKYPAGSVQKRSRPSGANTLTQFAHPGQLVQKRSRPVRANTLTLFVHPGQPVQKIREIPKKFSRPKRRQKRPFSR